MSTDIVVSVTPDLLQEVMQSRGFRVERADGPEGPVLQSATNGIGFNLRFGNKHASEESWLDWTSFVALRIDGELPEEIVNEWNRSHRFVRAFRSDAFLVLEMDVIVAAGVTKEHIHLQFEIWDQLVREFVAYLTRPRAQLEAVVPKEAAA